MRFGRTFSMLTNGFLALLVLGAALPGTHRVAWAQGYGLSEIAPRVWTDAPQREAEFLNLITQAQRTVAAFFGDAPSDPTIILCATQTCADNFGIGGNGLSIADMAVMVSPGGLTLGTLTHELTHSRLHRKMGARNIVQQPYPTWFDEGLATYVAAHPNWQGTISDAARIRVRQVSKFWQWDEAYEELGVGRAYMAARAEVANIEAKAGRAGLLELIQRAENGEPFDSVLTDILVRAAQ